MALTWEDLAACIGVIKRTVDPTIDNCVYEDAVIWINTVTDKGFLIKDQTITPLPITVGGRVPVPDSTLIDLQAAVSEIKSKFMSKTDYDIDENKVVDEAESIDGGTF